MKLESTNAPEVSGKYLTLTLGKECYGVEILKVQEIISVPDITRVPRCPAFMKGVVNLRGKIVPVVELRSKLGLAGIEYDEKACIVVLILTLKGEPVPVGVLVDSVVEVINYSPADIEPAPEALNADSSYILGIGRRQNAPLCLLLDINKLLSSGEVDELLTVERDSAAT